jgi:1-deoxy-D-xylulose-5-phosphate reductoisomerase
MKKRGIAILGSTGSIGTQAIEVIENNHDLLTVELLTANNNAELLVKQAIRLVPNMVIIGNRDKYNFVKSQLANFPVKVFSGLESIADAVQMESIDMVLTALVGYAGLLPTLKALEAGKAIALANKETMVIAGEMVQKLSLKNNAPVIPVDSEHSAIFQCLTGEEHSFVEKVILTASGGPFRNEKLENLKYVTKKEALLHPNWCMGDKITIDSASMMNKGLEAIEAKWLFKLKPSQIEVIVHPQSIIHSMVQFIDGSVKAQMGIPDMRVPIQFALTFPKRIRSEFPRINFNDCANLSFEAPDTKKFRNLAISFEAMEKGGNWPCLMNAANEIVVDAFLNSKIGFLEMSDIIEQVLQKSVFIKNPEYSDYCQSDEEARRIAKQLIK